MPDPARFDQCEIRRTPHHVACEVGEEKVILQTKTGQYLGMNPVAAFIWDLLATPRKSSELAQEIVAHYEVEPATAISDVEGFIADLSDAGLVEVKTL